MQLTRGANYSSVSHWAGLPGAKATCFLSTWKPWMAHFQPCANFIPRNVLECVSGNPLIFLHQSRVKGDISKGSGTLQFLFSVFLSKGFRRTNPRKLHKDSDWVCTPVTVVWDCDLDFPTNPTVRMGGGSTPVRTHAAPQIVRCLSSHI